MSNFTFLDVARVCQILLSDINIRVKKRHLSNMFPTKCRGQNDRVGRPVISCVCQNLDVSLFNWICHSNLKFYATPLLHFLCLIISFYRRYVSCIYIISNISNTYSIYPIYRVSIQYALLFPNQATNFPQIHFGGRVRRISRFVSENHAYVYIYIYICMYKWHACPRSHTT